MAVTPGISRTEGNHRARWVASVYRVVNALLNGKHNAHGSVTLTASAATSTLTDPRIGGDSKVFLSPTTANAAAEVGAGTLYISAVLEGSATLTHANNGQTDRTYHYVIAG